MSQIPLVDYLKLGDEPHLIAHKCDACGARFFDRRNACAACGGLSFHDVDLPTTGTLTSFSIVHFAAPGIPVPFVAALVECDGTTIRGNLVNVDPSPDVVHTGLKVRLTTTSVGTDSEDVEAVSFAFEPVN